ncbi:hypothetical protein HMPREF9413_4049 [Paenibacillus sp. HGF7]|nr:hypothetical protein HMPREF9413_4049 [Paenibacillus sp. HGF7]
MLYNLFFVETYVYRINVHLISPIIEVVGLTEAGRACFQGSLPFLPYCTKSKSLCGTFPLSSPSLLYGAVKNTAGHKARYV